MYCKSATTRASLQVEHLEPRHLMASVPFGATPDDTGEFMLGDVVVSVVFMESDGSIDPNTENWSAQQQRQVKQKIEDGLAWWSDMLDRQNSVHSLNFITDYYYVDHPVQTGYEPISRKSEDFVYWMEDFFADAGLDTAEGYSSRIRQFNHQQRIAHDANWAFTIFVVDAENDADNRFHTDGNNSMAYAFAGGRFFVITSERPAASVAHETAHMFWAMDEYAKSKSYYAHRGYYNTQNLNAADQHPDPQSRVRSIMDAQSIGYSRHAISPSAMEMIGWKDSDHDGIFDVLDVPLAISGTGTYNSSDNSVRFTGSASAATLANKNPSGTGNDMTLNRVSRIEFRRDDGPWNPWQHFDQYEVDFDFVISAGTGTQQIEVRAVDDATGVTSATLSASIARDQPVIWRNEFFPTDVSADGHLSPVDALLVINYLNNNGSRKLESTGVVGGPPYIDVNGDGYVAPSDALQVINALNQSPVSSIPTERADSTEIPAEGEFGSTNVDSTGGIRSSLDRRGLIGDRIRSARALDALASNRSVPKIEVSKKDFALAIQSPNFGRLNIFRSKNVNRSESLFADPLQERHVSPSLEMDAIDAAFAIEPLAS
jgi:hypothetical protein